MDINIGNETYRISLRRYTPDGWEPDCFHDMEPNFRRDHRADGHGTIIATAEELDNLVDWWEEETKQANAGVSGDGLVGLTKEEIDKGVEWTLFVELISYE